MKAKTPSINDGITIMLFLQAKIPNMRFRLRMYGQRYMHVMHDLFCVTTCPVGEVKLLGDKLSDLSLQKLNRWVLHEINLLGI